MSLAFDLTGADPVYKRTGVQFRVYAVGQPLEFGEPVFADSVVVKWIEDGTGIEHLLTENIQWEHVAADKDWDAMSQAGLQDNTFEAELIKSIRNREVFSGSRTYVVEYQALHLQPSEYDYGINGPTPNPGLMQELITTMRFLRDAQNPLNDITSETVDTIQVLEEDLTGLDDNNLISDELHTVDVPTGKRIIRPSCGAFYRHDVALVLAADDSVLVEGTDYNIIGMNRPKTAVAEHTSGVYDYILVTAAVVGDIKVTYRAFGGDVTVSDINSIKDVLISIVERLTTAGYVTETSFPNLQVVVDMLNRIGVLEDDVRHFVTASHTYAAPTDGKHWFTIGNIYRDQWNTENIGDAVAHLGIKCYSRKWTYDVLVSIGLDRTEPLKVTTLASSDVDNQFEMNSYDRLPDRDVPELRLVWQKVAGEFSGALLQLGMTMVHDEQEVIVVTDKSGSDSDFNVRPNVIGDDVTIDDNIELPNGETWVDGAADNYVARMLMTPLEGYLAWAGAAALHEITADLTGADSITIIPGAPDEVYYAQDSMFPICCIKDQDFLIANIKKVTIFIYDRINDRMIVKSNEHYGDENETVKRGSVLFFPEDLCSLKYFIVDNDTAYEHPVFALQAELGSHSKINERFDLRQIVIWA